jgi:hypothetical protein
MGYSLATLSYFLNDRHYAFILEVRAAKRMPVKLTHCTRLRPSFPCVFRASESDVTWFGRMIESRVSRFAKSQSYAVAGGALCLTAFLLFSFFLPS